MLNPQHECVELPTGQPPASASHHSGEKDEPPTEEKKGTQRGATGEQGPTVTAKATSAGAIPRSETPSTQGHPSEDTASTSPTTPTSSVQTQQTPTAAAAPTPSRPGASGARPAMPAIPVIPALPKTSPKSAKPAGAVQDEPAAKDSVIERSSGSVAHQTAEETGTEVTAPAAIAASAPAAAPIPAKPKLWSGLFGKPATPSSSSVNATTQDHVNGAATDGTGSASGAAGSFSKTHTSAVAEALDTYRVGNASKVAFLEPRGLVNTGNMCYMNSVRAPLTHACSSQLTPDQVLQVLIFCVPFYDLLDILSKKAAYSFKSSTPLLDSL